MVLAKLNDNGSVNMRGSLTSKKSAQTAAAAKSKAKRQFMVEAIRHHGGSTLNPNQFLKLQKSAKARRVTMGAKNKTENKASAQTPAVALANTSGGGRRTHRKTRKGRTSKRRTKGRKSRKNRKTSK